MLPNSGHKTRWGSYKRVEIRLIFTLSAYRHRQDPGNPETLVADFLQAKMYVPSYSHLLYPCVPSCSRQRSEIFGNV